MRKFLVSSVASLLGLLSLVTVAQDSAQPNVLVIIVDDEG